MARKRVIWSIRARQDLGDILRFYRERNGNNVYCRKLRNEFRKVTDRIASNAEIGASLDNSDLRSIVVDPYQLFYRITETEIEIVTVWDARRNPGDLKI